MMLNSKELFELRKASIKGAKSLYEGYLIRMNQGSINDTAAPFLKAFLHCPVNECIRIIRSNENTHLSTSIWGEDYIYLISLLAAYHLDKNEITEGLLWADKAISLVDYFSPTLNKDIREVVLYNLPASAMVCAFPKQYLEAPCNSFFLDWELDDRYGISNFHNDN